MMGIIQMMQMAVNTKLIQNCEALFLANALFINGRLKMIGVINFWHVVAVAVGCVFRVEPAVMITVNEINAHADYKPNCETYPGDKRKTLHKKEAGQYSEYGRGDAVRRLKGLLRSGSFILSTRIPAQTSTNAKSVPMLQRSTISSMLINAENTATKTPVTIVAKNGVLYEGCIELNIFGRSPSRDIENKIRGWPI